MDDFTGLAERYIAVWNESDPVQRRLLVERLWSGDARYVDPLADVSGHDGIDTMIGAVQGQFPGMTFSLAGDVDAHHEQARFCWELGAEGSAALVFGFDVALRGPDGRLVLVLGFLDKVPTR